MWFVYIDKLNTSKEVLFALFLDLLISSTDKLNMIKIETSEEKHNNLFKSTL